MIKSKTVLKRALKLFGPNGERWGKRYYKSNDKFCSLGAIRETISSAQFFILYTPVKSLLQDVVGGNVIAWNDNPIRKWPEVKAAFEKAIELAT